MLLRVLMIRIGLLQPFSQPVEQHLDDDFLRILAEVRFCAASNSPYASPGAAVFIRFPSGP